MAVYGPFESDIDHGACDNSFGRQAVSGKPRGYDCGREAQGRCWEKVSFSEVVMHVDGSEIKIGSPLVEGATVTGEVVEQFKDKKVIAFKYRRRKGYHRTVGHRRRLTRVKIESIEA